MDDFLNKLKNNKILTKEDILLLKKNISEEHPHLDNSSKAHILAKSIHNIFNESLRGFTRDYKSSIKTYLIRNTLLKDMETIYQYDVLKACASSEDTSLEFIYQIAKWVSKQANEEIALNTVKSLIQEIDIDDNYMDDEISLSNILEHNTEAPNTNEPSIQEASEDAIDPIDNEVEDSSISKYPLDNIEPLDPENNLDSQAESEEIEIQSNPVKHYITQLKNKFQKIVHTDIENERFKKYILIYSLLICLLIVPIAHIVKNYLFKESNAFIEVVSSLEYNEKLLEKNNVIIIDEEIQLITSHLPDYLKYREINQKNLKTYLAEKNSLLSIEPYFTTIIDCSKEFNINPILLFSIAGHEQSYVPKDNKYAEKIVNNPYNVFQSWKKYNTDIEDSSKIVCRTVINLLKDKPEKEDPFKWINRKYAEDKNWWRGVKEIFDTLEEKTKIIG